jgi:hypothetical protein
MEALRNPLSEPTTVGKVSYTNLQGNFRLTKEQQELLSDVAETIPNPNNPKKKKIKSDKLTTAHGQV